MEKEVPSKCISKWQGVSHSSTQCPSQGKRETGREKEGERENHGQREDLYWRNITDKETNTCGDMDEANKQKKRFLRPPPLLLGLFCGHFSSAPPDVRPGCEELQNRSLLIKMSSAPEPPSSKNEPPKEKDYRIPGLRGARTTTLFRAVNPELFIKPNKPVMAFGLITLTLCVAYIGYLHATQENKKELYEAVDSEGARYMRRRTSKWD
ncbi:small integral membrane protein 8 isoform X2 [Tachyglossus aculeatus]|uniref:small integral membrane protein 8 isoform X2 n=1 Tax=Tachyglossus aculeatus TaxID=9261 RepID=UPI0018F46E8D|nr:small integral membrane protein 8 isoform X2 [Tachyglossus aculeatus]